MASFELVLTFLCGLFIGGGVTWFAARTRGTTEAQLADKFKALAADTLRQNNETFLHLAESRLKQSEQSAAATLDKKTVAIDEMVKPVKESLQKMDAHLQALEVKREGAYRELLEMVQASRETGQQLRGELGQLLQALRSPATRGRWGEMQLKRILEMTGMSAHTRDFAVQQTIADEEGVIRPDLIVALPGNRVVVIDSKVPLTAYLDAVQGAEGEVFQEALRRHAKQVREHIRALGNKAYWRQVEGSVEFVVLFLPGEHFLSATLNGDCDLLEYGYEQGVILATPTTLIALLRTIATGWQQETLKENVRQVAYLGREIFDALTSFASQLASIGGKLGATIEAYNKSVNMLERQVLGKARKLSEFGAAPPGEELPMLETVDRQPRLVTAVRDERKGDAA